MGSPPPPATPVLSGRVHAHEVDLGFQVGGRIARSLADEGGSVPVGQPLAELGTTDLQLAVERARARAESATQARAATAQAQADQALADQQVQRTQQPVAQNFVSPAQMDRATADVAAAHAAKHSAEHQLGYVTLATALAGVVSVRLAESGPIVAPGQPALRVAEL
jgi:multidrug efflux pump subunit AcrA (membrane-fusion protein)